MEVLLPIIIVAAVCAGISAAISSEENKTMAILVGALLGPFGILIAAIAFREGA